MYILLLCDALSLCLSKWYAENSKSQNAARDLFGNRVSADVTELGWGHESESQSHVTGKLMKRYLHTHKRCRCGGTELQTKELRIVATLPGKKKEAKKESAWPGTWVSCW